MPDLTIENYAEELNTLIKSLDETTVYETALKQVTDAVEAQRRSSPKRSPRPCASRSRRK